MAIAASDAPLIAEQIAYYRDRAGEYDQWWLRTGRFDRGALLNDAWHADCRAVESTLDAHLADRSPQRVLEFACGTGLFTRRLAPAATRVLAIDASPEVLAINRARTALPNVEYVEANLFEWRSPERFDLVFFSFWLSHVPDNRFAAFWAQVREQLAPGGTAYLIDSAFDPTSTATNHVLSDTGVVTRRLNDGREFKIVKIFHRPDELDAKLDGIRWKSGIGRTARYFIHGPALPA